MVKNILITGPESTGKSTICIALAEQYDTLWVKEYARDYIDRLHRPYIESDLKKIGERQLEIQKINLELAHQFLFCDTGLEVIKIWSEYKYKRCDPWVIEHLSSQQFDAVFLLDIDVPWEYDEQREHPNPEDRKAILEIFKKELTDIYGGYHLINGNLSERIKKITDILKEVPD
ncbi:MULTISPECIES: AAA family ATPase [Flammeovirga]|uniref:ATP-binding protein n=1 Tax=Flammeovirga agarivorans TaxID=2726742 RepID=A0A7X8XUK0_9BACT|nr:MULTISPECIES: ATP-binding protein [Flammeovirga]NLR90200.1 ATP-binding protein [Flammeovirga agarivorans]